jgi:hypothetical protein
MQFDAGIENMQLTLDGAKEHDIPNSAHIVTCERARFIHFYRNGTQVSQSITTIAISLTYHLGCIFGQTDCHIQSIRKDGLALIRSP